jgi:hypothetical protein
MTNPMMRIHDIETDEIIDREMTDEEYAEFKKALEPTKEELAKAKAKEAILTKLGITAEEAAALLG